MSKVSSCFRQRFDKSVRRNRLCMSVAVMWMYTLYPLSWNVQATSCIVRIYPLVVFTHTNTHIDANIQYSKTRRTNAPYDCMRDVLVHGKHSGASLTQLGIYECVFILSHTTRETNKLKHEMNSIQLRIEIFTCVVVFIGCEKPWALLWPPNKREKMQMRFPRKPWKWKRRKCVVW